MKIVFFDLIGFDYSVGTVFEAPLGGSQSALCYLTMNLANLGHEIFIVNQVSAPTISYGVTCLPINCVTNKLWQMFDFVICFNGANSGEVLREICGEATNIILWNQHAHDQPAVQNLHKQKEREAYDAFFFISDWQAKCFIEKFDIEREKITIVRNAISFAFEDLFKNQTSILTTKSKPITLAYTSTPFRGLDLLVDIFPKIREKFPSAELKIFSSMKVYQMPDEQDSKDFGSLYEALNAIEGVDYVGSLSQPELAKALKGVSILSYPNTFSETSCIAVMEALASGCHVITSDLGALPETTAGFATLVTFNPDLEIYKRDFVEAIIEYITKLKTTDANRVEEQLQSQVDYCQQNYVWKERAQEWLEKLYEIRGYKFFCLEDYQSAITLYEEAISVYPDNVFYYCYLVLSLVILGEQEAAISILLLCVSNNKTSESSDLHGIFEKIVELEIQRLTENNNRNSINAIHEFISLLE
ncbi:glycosyltransferase family 4 protein [Synechocystis sp. FACHB-383]|uniref:glycosyltransferase family 4 protein n=1 Tax=Synechocystis sp. FACHB-383 TaxID=2692864 RepID=UPI0016873C7B|nr:glycosyltransferase family 4 protein [Synechocystis sp. FACHB-383]MBD2654402.1 glycosyltransferase family 4 protein [Synechocystis sp. FACHB-383]